MASIVVRFPGGEKEFRYPPKLPEQGEAIWHDGQRYRVVSVIEADDERATVIVELESPRVGDMLRSEEGALRLEPIEV